MRATRRRRNAGWMAVVVCVTLAVGEGGAFAGDAKATEIAELDVVVDAEAIRVVGRADFVDAPVQVGEDLVGDAMISGAAPMSVPVGDDLATATIARPDPSQRTLTFTLGIDNQPALLGSVPEAMQYHWDFVVDGGSVFRLLAVQTQRSSSWLGDTRPDFFLTVLESRRTSTPPAGAYIKLPPGRMAGGIVQWPVPMGWIGATDGSAIRTIGEVESVVGVGGPSFWLGPGLFLDQSVSGTGDEMSVQKEYTIPGATVQLGIAPSGTPTEQVDLNRGGLLDMNGGFRTALARPADPGNYTVVVKACYGPENCDLATADVMVE